MLPHSTEFYNSLPSFEAAVGAQSDSIENVKAVFDLLRSHNIEHHFGVQLAHRHFSVHPDEIVCRRKSNVVSFAYPHQINLTYGVPCVWLVDKNANAFRALEYWHSPNLIERKISNAFVSDYLKLTDAIPSTRSLALVDARLVPSFTARPCFELTSEELRLSMTSEWCDAAHQTFKFANSTYFFSPKSGCSFSPRISCALCPQCIRPTDLQQMLDPQPIIHIENLFDLGLNLSVQRYSSKAVTKEILVELTAAVRKKIFH